MCVHVAWSEAWPLEMVVVATVNDKYWDWLPTFCFALFSVPTSETTEEAHSSRVLKKV